MERSGPDASVVEVVRLGPAVVARSRTQDARVLASSLVAQQLGIDADGLQVSHLCPRCGSDAHGRPVIVTHPEVNVSLSRAGDWNVAAVRPDAPVGIDAETPDAARPGLRPIVSHPRETWPDDDALLCAWVAKEAVGKALGVGLDAEPTSIRLSPTMDRVVAGPGAGLHLWWHADGDLIVALASL